MHRQSRHYCMKALLLIAVLVVSGCKEVLFSNLDETEANEMVAVLAAAGLPASRSRDKDNVYELLVHKEHVAAATTLLRKDGFPRPKFQTLGDVFSADGIVGTPFEQHARYIFAMNEELSHTISSISGVQSARVFVTSPPKDRYARTPPVASASVTINYENGFDMRREVSKIKTIVAHSVPNLNYDKVAVALFAAHGPSVRVKPVETGTAPLTAAAFGSFELPDTMSPAGWLAAVAGGACMLFALILLLLRPARGKRVRRDA